MEGSTAWETFWRITFPTISPMILVAVVYTVIDSFSDYNNELMRMIVNTVTQLLRFSYGAALSWIFFVSVSIVLAIIIFLVSKFVVYTD